MLRNPDRAVALLHEASRRAPGSDTLGTLGTGLLLLRRYAEAERNLRQALTFQPDSLSVKLNLADSLLLLEREEEARRLYRQIVDQAEQLETFENWRTLSIKAQALAHLGEAVQANRTVRQTLSMKPDDAQLAYEAAIVYAVLGDRNAALFHARQAARRGIDTALFGIPFFDSLRNDPAFQALTKQQAGRSGPGQLRSLNLF